MHCNKRSGMLRASVAHSSTEMASYPFSAGKIYFPNLHCSMRAIDCSSELVVVCMQPHESYTARTRSVLNSIVHS